MDHNLILFHERNILITKMCRIAFVLLLLLHILTKTSLSRALSIEGLFLIFLLLVSFLNKQKIYIKTTMYIIMTVATFGIFFLSFNDFRLEVKIIILFLFIPPLISMMYQNNKIILFTNCLSCLGFILNILQKPSVVFYEGYPQIYNVYIVAIFSLFTLIGILLSNSINKVMKENMEKQNHLLNEQKRILDLLNTQEKTNNAILSFNEELSENIKHTNNLNSKTKVSFNELRSAFQETAKSIDYTRHDLNNFHQELSEVKNSSEKMNNIVIHSNQLIQNGKMNLNHLLSIFNKITDNAEQNVISSHHLSKKTEEAEGIVSIVEHITSQINLLSLNASIEAARSGQAGKGFAVIADEIKKLSFQSNEATKEISNVLRDLKDNVQKTNQYSNHSKESINEGNSYINETKNSFETISHNNEDIHSSSHRLEGKITSLYALTDNLVSKTEIISQHAQDNHVSLDVLNQSILSVSKTLKETEKQSNELIKEAN